MRRTFAIALLLALVAPVAAKGQSSGWEEATVSLTPLIRYEAATTQFVQFPAPLTAFRSRRIERFSDSGGGIIQGRTLRAVFDQVELEYDGPYSEAFYDALVAFQSSAVAGNEFIFEGQYGEGLSGAWPLESIFSASTIRVDGPGFGNPLWPTGGGKPFVVYRVPESENREIRDRVILDYTEPISPFSSTYWVYLELPGLTRTDYVIGETMMRPAYTYIQCVLIDDNFELDILDANLMHVRMSFRDYAGITTP